jgi:hypothetical protein
MGQEFGYLPRERGGFVAIGKASSAIQNGDILDCAGFQIQLHC